MPSSGHLGSQTGPFLIGAMFMPYLTFTLLMDPPGEEQCSCRLANLQNTPPSLSCRYFVAPLNTRDSIDCFKLSLLSPSMAAPISMPMSNSAEDFFQAGP